MYEYTLLLYIYIYLARHTGDVHSYFLHRAEIGVAIRRIEAAGKEEAKYYEILDDLLLAEVRTSYIASGLSRGRIIRKTLFRLFLSKK